MKKWNVYQRNSGEVEAVKEGFNWWAFCFVGFWAFSKRLMWAGAIGLVLTTAANGMPSDVDILALPIIVVLMLVYGFMGNGWVAAKLERQGYSHAKQIEAASAEGAKAKFQEAVPTSQSSTS